MVKKKNNLHEAGYRPSWFPVETDRIGMYAMSVFELADVLHQSRHGAMEKLSGDKERLYIRSVKWVLESWTRSQGDYDDRVRELLVACLQEYGVVIE
jgi:hypothetical protein